MKVRKKTTELKVHPLNRSLYNISDVEELASNIKKVGLLQKDIIGTSNGFVYVGCRRLEALKLIDVKEIEVTIEDLPDDEIEARIVYSNNQRVKSAEETYREIKVLKAQLAKPQGFRSDLLSDEVKDEDGEELTTREKIAKIVGKKPTAVYQIETIGNRAFELLKYVDNNISLAEAYKACTTDKPKHQKLFEKIDLNEIKTCAYCGCVPRRIIKDENGQLKFMQNEK